MRPLLILTTLLLAAGCTKTPALIVAERNHNHWMTPGARLVVLQDINGYPDCETRASSDTTGKLWWILDSIGEENTIVIRKDFSYRYDTLDALDLRLVKREDLRKYRQMKHSYYSRFSEGYEHYKVYRWPDSSIRRVVCLDSLAGIVVPCIYTECATRRERFRTSFRGSPPMNKAFVFNANASAISIRWSY